MTIDPTMSGRILQCRGNKKSRARRRLSHSRGAIAATHAGSATYRKAVGAGGKGRGVSFKGLAGSLSHSGRATARTHQGSATHRKAVEIEGGGGEEGQLLVSGRMAFVHLGIRNHMNPFRVCNISEGGWTGGGESRINNYR